MISLLTIYTLWLRELVRFYRQPNRVIGALASPLLFWMVLGAGIGRSFQSQAGGGHLGYLGYFFPGTLMMIILFTAIFSTISIIEDRKEGFLQSVLVAPAPRYALILGKILGGSTLALIQASLFLFFTPMLGIHLGISGVILTVLILSLISFSLTGLGFALAWRMDSIQGFHAIMNLFLMPLWMLSGALFPTEGASGWIRILMKLNPLSYAMNLLRATIYGTHLTSMIDWMITAIFCTVIFIVANAAASKRERG